MLGPDDIARIKKAISAANSVGDIDRLEQALVTGITAGVEDLIGRAAAADIASLWDTTKEKPLLEPMAPKRVAVSVQAPVSRKTAREIHEEETAKKRFDESTVLLSVLCDKLVSLHHQSSPQVRDLMSISFEGPEGSHWESSSSDRSGKKKALIIDCQTVLCMSNEVYVPETLVRLSVCDFLSDRMILDIYTQFPGEDFDPVDFRPSITGLDTIPDDAVPFEEARSQLLNIISCDTVLVAHNAYRCARSLRLHHPKWVSLDTFFKVDPVKKTESEGKFYFRQPLSVPQLLQAYLGEVIAERLRTLSPHERVIECLLGCDRLIKAAARDATVVPVLVPPPRRHNSIFLTHIPSDWSEEEIKMILPKTIHVEPISFFLDIESNTWRGETTALFSSMTDVYDAFSKLTACTDVFVGWEWLACGKVTQESLRSLGEEYGPVLAVRVQDKYIGHKAVIPGKEESRPFGFVSMARYKDASDMALEPRQIVKDDVSYHVKISKKPISAFKRVPLGDGEDYVEAFIM